MLKEVREARQNEGEPPRRIFLSEEMALTIWFDGRNPAGFELVYNRSGSPHALRCGPNAREIEHLAVNSGEGRPGKPKMTPVFQSAEHEVAADLAERFADEASGIERGLREYVVERIRSYRSPVSP